MPTINQLIRKPRVAQKRGVCTTTPKKPDSALRKVAAGQGRQGAPDRDGFEVIGYILVKAATPRSTTTPRSAPWS